MWRKRLVKALGGILFGVVVAAVVAELGARVLVSQGRLPNRMPADIFAAHAIGWALEPDLSAKVFTSGGVVAIDANADGYRDNAYARSRREGVGRVLVLGDSFTLALETPQEETYHTQLEDRYDGAVEVLSLGVSGYGTEQELLAYQVVGRGYDPDLVLLMYYVGNDVTDNGSRPQLPHYTLEPDGSLTLHGYPYQGEFNLPLVAGQRSTWLMRNSVLALFAGVLLDAADNDADNGVSGPKPKAGSCGYLIGENFPHATEEDWALTEALILALRDSVEADGREFRLAIAPTELQVQQAYRDDFLRYCDLPEWVSDLDGYQTRLRAFLDTNAVVYLDLLPVLRENADSTGRELYFASNDVHWTPAGHDVVTDALVAWLALE